MDFRTRRYPDRYHRRIEFLDHFPLATHDIYSSASCGWQAEIGTYNTTDRTLRKIKGRLVTAFLQIKMHLQLQSPEPWGDVRASWRDGGFLAGSEYTKRPSIPKDSVTRLCSERELRLRQHGGHGFSLLRNLCSQRMTVYGSFLSQLFILTQTFELYSVLRMTQHERSSLALRKPAYPPHGATSLESIAVADHSHCQTNFYGRSPSCACAPDNDIRKWESTPNRSLLSL